MKLSVIICTHNPYKDYLDRTLVSLSKQTLPVGEWELIIVDNLSNPPLPPSLASDWHPCAKVVVQAELGLTHARLKGIQEAKGDLLVLVDDDNELNSNYLEIAWKLGESFSLLGAWGAGQVIPEFEGVPNADVAPYTYSLSLRRQEEPRWSNVNYITECSPMGAGMCVRKSVAEVWAHRVGLDPFRQGFDRRGDSLNACGDSDLALTACDVGLGNGVFPELEMIHLIPAKRYEEDHLVKISYGWGYSSTLFDSIRRKNTRVGESPLIRWLKLRLRPSLQTLFAKQIERRIEMASAKGTYDALNELDRPR